MLQFSTDRDFVVACPPAASALESMRRALGSGQADCYAFQHPDIIDVWIQTIGRRLDAEARLVIITARHGAFLAAVPLVRLKRFGITTISYIDGGVSDYNAPILMPDFPELDTDAMLRLLSRIVDAAGGADIVDLQKMPPAVGRRSNPFMLLPVVPAEMVCYAAHFRASADSEDATASRLPKDWDNWRLANIGGGFRRKSGQLMRNLDKLGPAKYAPAANQAEAQRLVEAIFRIKRKANISRHGFDPLATAGFVEFYSRIGREQFASKLVEVASATIGDRIIAASLCYRYERRQYYLLTAYDSGEFSPFSPGRLLTEKLMQWSFESGADTFDFCLGEESYKQHYCKSQMPLYGYRQALTSRGRVALAGSALTRYTMNGLRKSSRARMLVRKIRSIRTKYSQARSNAELPRADQA